MTSNLFCEEEPLKKLWKVMQPRFNHGYRTIGGKWGGDWHNKKEQTLLGNTAHHNHGEISLFVSSGPQMHPLDIPVCLSASKDNVSEKSIDHLRLPKAILSSCCSQAVVYLMYTILI